MNTIERRLDTMQQELTLCRTDLATIKTMLAERCDARGAMLARLEAESQRRKGGMAVIGVVWTCASFLGGMAARFYLP